MLSPPSAHLLASREVDLQGASRPPALWLLALSASGSPSRSQREGGERPGCVTPFFSLSQPAAPKAMHVTVPGC